MLFYLHAIKKNLWLKIILGTSVKVFCEPDVKQIIISRDGIKKDRNVDITKSKEGKVVVHNLEIR